MMHLTHTCLMKVVSRERGKAIFLLAHPFMLDTSVHFHNDKFKHYEYETLVVATFRCTSTRRHLTRVAVDVDVKTTEDFTVKYADLLKRQQAAFEKWVSTSSEEMKAKWGSLSSAAEDAASVITKLKGVAEEIDRETAAPAAPAASAEEESYQKHRPIPTRWLGNTYIDSSIATVFEAARVLSDTRPVKLLMIGPSGYGKTTIPEEFAKAWDLSFLRMNCAVVRDPEEWFGFREARDGSTVFLPTRFTQAVRTGNHVIVMDELNRVEPWLHNPLFDLFDHAAQTIVHDEVIKAGPNLIFVGTINLGAQFTGTFTMDAAMRNRMDAFIPVSPLDVQIESQIVTRKIACSAKLATLIVLAMKEIRDVVAKNELEIDCSTRTSLKIAELVSIGKMPLRHAFAAVIIDMLESDGQKLVTDAISDIIRK